MKDFFKRAILFAVFCAALIGLMILITPLSFDNCVLYPVLFCCVIGIPYEFWSAHRQERKPVISEFVGAAWFGSIVAGFIIYGIHLLIG